MRAFAVAVLANLGGAKLFDELDLAFMNYIAQHSKNYASLEEFNLRFENFAKFDAEIKHFNSVQSDSVHGHNALSDWTAEERQALSGYRDEYEAKTEYPETMLGIPTAVNWCTAGDCNAIQNQGNCGSCWAFAAAATMESAKKIQYGTLPKYSEQNFTSCCCSGCNGGNYTTAWSYASANPIESETSYPYTSGSTGVTGTCQYVSSKGIGKVSTQLSCGTSDANMQACIASRPYAVTVAASTSYFQSYKSGVLNNASLCGTANDHAIVAVGYDITNNYWIVRNSWGTTWGLSGYGHIAMGSPYPGVCGINKFPRSLTMA